MVLVLVLMAGCGPNVEAMLEGGDVDGLIAVLASDAAVPVRADAAGALAKLQAAAALDALLTALEDPAEEIRAAAAEALGGLRQQRALLPLLARSEDAASAVRGAASEAVRRLLQDLDSSAAADELVTALSDESPVVRTAASELLGGLGEEVALLPLLLQLEDDDTAVRETSERAVDALVDELPARTSAVILSEAIGEDGIRLRVTAARLLGGLGQRAGMPTLLGLHADPDQQVRAVAAEALAALVDELPAEVAVRGLHGALEDPRPAAADAADAALRELLAVLGPERAVTAIQGLDSSDTWLAVALDVAEDQLAARTRQLGLQLEPLDEIQRAAVPAVDGMAVPGSHTYEASDGFHPAVVIGSAQWSQSEQWTPTALRFLELVVTTDEIDWRVIEVCAYNGPDITRFQGRQTVRVLSAHDGDQVAERTFEGTNPRACRQEEPWSLEELFGDHPDLGDAASWLGSIINPPS